MFRYLHNLRHYRDKRQEAGYHQLDRSRLEERDLTVTNMKELEETVSSYRVQEWCDLSKYPGSLTSSFPRVRSCPQVLTTTTTTSRKAEHYKQVAVHNFYNLRLSRPRNQEQIIETQMGTNVVESNIHLHFKIYNNVY